MKLNRMLLSLAVSGLLVLPLGAMAQADKSGSTTTWGGQNQSSQSQNQADQNKSDQNNAKLPQSDQGPSSQRASDKNDKNVSGKLSMSESRFLKKAAEDDIGEVDLAKLAEQKAGSEQVKDMASKIEQQHQQNLDQVKSLAQQKGVQVPDKAQWSQRREKAKLEKLSGADFDRQYASFLAKEHQTDIKDFQSEQSKAKDPDVKSYIDQTLPTLQQHEQMAMRNEQGKPSASSKQMSH